jgi:hypothetical protein
MTDVSAELDKKQKARERSKVWRENNKDKNREYKRNYYSKNNDRLRAYSNAYMKTYYENNPAKREKHNERMRMLRPIMTEDQKTIRKAEVEVKRAERELERNKIKTAEKIEKYNNAVKQLNELSGGETPQPPQ